MIGWVNGFMQAGMNVSIVTPEAHPLDPYFLEGDDYSGLARLFTVKIFDPARLARSRNDAVEQITGNGSAIESRGFLSRLRPWLLLPDQRRFANAKLAKVAANLIDQDKTLLITSSPYNSIHLVGRKLKKQLENKILWIADFRDDWFHPVFFPYPTKLHKIYNLRLERSILLSADGITLVSEQTLVKLRSRHDKSLPADYLSNDSPGICKLVPNGFDPTGLEDVLTSDLPVKNPHAPLHILFSGTLWQNHPLESFVEAMDRLAESTGQTFFFELAGRVVCSLPVPRNPEQVKIAVTEWKPYEEALLLTRQADLLLVHTGPERQDLKIKVFDCAAVHRPILVLGPEDSRTTQFVREHVECPLVAGQNDVVQIQKCLEKLLSTSDRKVFGFSRLPDTYNRIEQSKVLLGWAQTLKGRD